MHISHEFLEQLDVAATNDKWQARKNKNATFWWWIELIWKITGRIKEQYDSLKARVHAVNK